MKKNNLFFGAAQIVLSILIFCSGAAFSYLEYQKSVRMRSLLEVSVRQAAIYEKGIASLELALKPIRAGVAGIVSLRDYQVMNKKVFYHLGNSFVGLQRSCEETQRSLSSARQSFHEVAVMPIQSECYWDFGRMICLAAVFAFAGLGFLLNGIYLCLCKK